MASVTFTLNGRKVVVEPEDGVSLLDVLREDLGITSPKDGCSGEGTCGCCTILLDDRPALSCLLKPAQVAGRVVITLEGLPTERRNLLARSFVQEGGIQCGFCTPGIVTRASALIDRGQASDRERVAKALRAHICRCTGYGRIVDAIQTAGEAATAGGQLVTTEPRHSPSFATLHSPENDTGVGGSPGRYRGLEHAMGEKPYVADLRVDVMLHAAVVLSEHARARIVGIDTNRAANAPGVVRVFTANDIPGTRHHGLIVNDWPLMIAVGETTRCVGDILAVVVADSQHQARRAAALVEVESAVLEPITSPTAALAADAPKIHPDGNLLEICAFSRGDVETALSEAEHVVEEIFTTQRIEHAFLEPEACLAVPQAKGGLKVYSQGQGVHDDQRQIAAILGVAREAVEVELVTNGGAFGGKEDLSVQGHAALAAHLLRRPVRLVLTREQSIRLHPKRHPLALSYTVGADSNGRLTAVRARIVGDTGAYASVGMKVLERAAGHSCGPYRVPNVDVEAKTVYTNNPPCGAMRGFGANQAAFAIEGVVDRLAARIGIDGYTIRERNVLQPGDVFATGQRMTASCGIRQTLEAVRHAFRNARFAGIACGIKNTGIGNGMADIGRVVIRVQADCQLEILTGYTEMGQGLHTILRQVVREETGVDQNLMSVRTVSEVAVQCGMTTASRATALTTEAGRRAAVELAEAMADGGLDSLTGREFLGEYVCDFTTAPGADVAEPVTHLTFGYATQVVILDDDGRIQKVVAAHDVGRAINPLQCAGQIEGGVHMGLGYALSEDLPCTDGMPDSLKLKDLGIIPAHRTPEIEVILVEVPDEVGGYGSKGVGEIGLVPTAGAVAGALHAFDGAWRNALPMTTSPAAEGLVPKARRGVG